MPAINPFFIFIVVYSKFLSESKSFIFLVNIYDAYYL